MRLRDMRFRHLPGVTQKRVRKLVRFRGNPTVLGLIDRLVKAQVVALRENRKRDCRQFGRAQHWLERALMPALVDAVFG